MIPLKDENPTERTPVVTILLILACVGVYFFWQPSPASDTAADVDFTYRNAAIPCEVLHGRPLTIDELRATAADQTSCGATGSEPMPGVPDKRVWLSVLVSIFLHGSIVHLGFNMLFLWIFGNNIEDRMGRIRFAVFYLAGGIAATAVHVGLNTSSTVPVVGASGAIAAVMGAYLVWFPDAPVRTLIAAFFILVVRIRAKWLLIFWFVLQFLTDPNSGVAWAAHVGGFVFGAVVALLIRSSRPARRATLRSHHATDAWDNTGGAGYQWFEEERRFGGRRR